MLTGIPTHTYNGYFYRLLFCETCEKYTTHRTPVIHFNGTFSGDPLVSCDWKCIDCIKKIEELTKCPSCKGELDSYHRPPTPCPHCSYKGGPK